MLGFVNERKATKALGALASSTPAGVASAAPVERAAALILCNVMLIAGSRTWGREVLQAPARLPRQVAVGAVCLLADDHVRLEAAATSMDGRAIGDPAVRALRWELMSNEIVTLTIGCQIDDASARAMRECWKAIWASRRFRDEALQAMGLYAKAYSVEPTPRIDGKRPSDDLLRRLGAALPPMFPTRRRAPS